MKKGIITNSLKNSFKTISKNKKSFLLLFITQSIFIILLSAVFTHYAVNVGEHAKAILEPLQESGTAQQDIISLYDAPEQIAIEYQAMIKDIFLFFLSALLIYIILNGINWNITNLIVNKKHDFLNYQSSFAVIFLIFILPAILIINLILRLLLNTNLVIISIILCLKVLICALYFMYVSFSLINNYKIKQLKLLLKQTYMIGIKNLKILIPTYVIIVLPLIIFILLIYFSLEANMLLLFLLCILFVLSINWARIYFLITMKEIKNRLI